MNRIQKKMLIRFLFVLLITTVMVLLMINLKDQVNRSEASRAMGQLGDRLLEYRKVHSALPPESYIESIRDNLAGSVRLGKINYRALWIDSDSSPDTILAYVEKKYRSLFLGRGYIVLRLDGSVEWVDKDAFEKELSSQQGSDVLKITPD